jgi:tol-pal system protein YbgF
VIKRILLFVLLILVIGGISSTAFSSRAEAPVFNLNQTEESSINQGLEIDSYDSTPASKSHLNHVNESLDQKVLRLERQIANLTEMNYASKLERMQQEMQQLHGQLEVQNHDLSQLKEQLKSFYQDLDQQINKLTPEGSKKKSASTPNKISVAESSDAFVDNNNGKTKELQTYEAAFNLLNKKEYDNAISGFQAFVKKFPESMYTANAHYWLGEIYYLKGKSESANREFQVIITDYPDNAKVADAILKVGLIAMDAGNNAKAKQNFIKVQKQFPGTTAAKIASLRLKEIKQKY